MTIRKAASRVAAAFGAIALFVATAELEIALHGKGRAWAIVFALIAGAAPIFFLAIRLARAPRSIGLETGHIVLFETPMLGPATTDTPALTIRGARDAIERFIPLAEFGSLFGGYALWHPPANPIPELPDEALGVWSRRLCKRFRRILRERGATVAVRREAGPEQRIKRLVQQGQKSMRRTI